MPARLRRALPVAEQPFQQWHQHSITLFFRAGVFPSPALQVCSKIKEKKIIKSIPRKYLSVLWLKLIPSNLCRLILFTLDRSDETSSLLFRFEPGTGLVQVLLKPGRQGPAFQITHKPPSAHFNYMAEAALRGLQSSPSEQKSKKPTLWCSHTFRVLAQRLWGLVSISHLLRSF